MPRRTELESPAVGTGLRPVPCRTSARASEPPPARPGHPRIGLTFSGGGFRATLAALGAARLLASIGRLEDVRLVSSVSGGSIANGLLARRWPELRAAGFTPAAVDELCVQPACERIAGEAFKRVLLRNAWRALGPAQRTDVLARCLDDWFFERCELAALDPGARFIYNASNLVTGVRFAFEREVVGDYVIGSVPTAGTGLRLAQAVAASASFPGAFSAWQLRGLSFPCADRPPRLLDGGAYDNTGLEAIDSDRYRDVFTVSLNAGGLFHAGAYGRLPVLGELARVNALLYRQSTALRTRWMVERFERGRVVPDGAEIPPDARRGVLVALATDLEPGDDGGALAAWHAAHPPLRTWDGRDLALVPTTFDRYPPGLCRALVYRGWWLVGAALCRYHPTLVPDPAALAPPAVDP